jgi:signal transduction histidine kinase
MVSLLLSYFVLRRIRGKTVARALARRPALFPEVSAAVAHVRHDVLKHRASALGLIATGSPRQEVARVLLEPAPASLAVEEVYQRLHAAAAGAGAPLCALPREPVFGPLHTTLRRAEALLASGRDDEALEGIDEALRQKHGPALAALLGHGPRTALDPQRLSRWIAGVEAGLAGRDPPVAWTSPALLLDELRLEAIVDEGALAAIFANLLRNAIEAVAEAEERRVVVRVCSERDATGRRLVTVLVADSAPRTLTVADIEARDGQRGLGIVRELARRWGGHTVVRTEAAPLVKAIGVRLPAAGEGPS